MNLLDLALLFFRLGAVSFGGGLSVLAELQHELVEQRAAVTQQQFATAFALGQATPGPGVLYLIPLGFYVAGAPGALVAIVSFLLPPLLLQVVVARQWETLSRSPWIRAVDRALVPISVGLIGGSLHALGTPLLTSPSNILGLALASVALLVFRVSPPVIMLGAGLLGLLGVL